MWYVVDNVLFITILDDVLHLPVVLLGYHGKNFLYHFLLLQFLFCYIRICHSINVLEFYIEWSPRQFVQCRERCVVVLQFWFFLLFSRKTIITLFDHSYFPITIRLLSSWWFFSLSVFVLPFLYLVVSHLSVIIIELDALVACNGVGRAVL